MPEQQQIKTIKGIRFFLLSLPLEIRKPPSGPGSGGEREGEGMHAQSLVLSPNSGLPMAVH
jgi:hypothetical protein